MYNHVHMFPQYKSFIDFEKLFLDKRSNEYALYIYNIYIQHIFIYIYIYIYIYTYKYICLYMCLYMFNKYI